MAWLLRCQTKFSRRTKKSKLEPPDLLLSGDELRNAETELTKFLQRAHFPGVFAQPQSMQNNLLQKITAFSAKTTSSYFGWRASCGWTAWEGPSRF